jgi:hypothetical protein
VTPEENEKPAAITQYKRRENVVDRLYNVNLDMETDNAVGKSTSPVSRGAKASGKRKRATEGDSEVAEDDDWIVEAPAAKSRAKQGSQSSSQGGFFQSCQPTKGCGQQARTTVKKSPQKWSGSPAIRTPHTSKTCVVKN